MNFLAHLHLSGENDGLIVGNFLADFIRNSQVEDLPEPIREGVALHRMIDTYTDNHPMVRQSSARLRPKHRKYAPVLVDVFYDFLLARNWGRYHAAPLSNFTASTYQVLEEHRSLMPPFLQERLSLMIADDWLHRYTTPEGLSFVFSRMKRRLTRPEWLSGALDSLLADLEAYEEEFNAFFPEVIEFVKGGERGERV